MRLILIGWTMLVLFCLAGCSPSAPTSPPRTQLTALISGELKIEPPCLKLVITDAYTPYSLIFPEDWSVDVNQQAVILVGPRVGPMMILQGQTVEVGGGEITALSDLAPEAADSVPAECSAPYWLVGSDFRTK